MQTREAAHMICAQVWLAGSAIAPHGWISLFMIAMGVAYFALWLIGDYLASRQPQPETDK